MSYLPDRSRNSKLESLPHQERTSRHCCTILRAPQFFTTNTIALRQLHIFYSIMVFSPLPTHQIPSALNINKGKPISWKGDHLYKVLGRGESQRPSYTQNSVAVCGLAGWKKRGPNRPIISCPTSSLNPKIISKCAKFGSFSVSVAKWYSVGLQSNTAIILRSCVRPTFGTFLLPLFLFF